MRPIRITLRSDDESVQIPTGAVIESLDQDQRNAFAQTNQNFAAVIIVVNSQSITAAYDALSVVIMGGVQYSIIQKDRDGNRLRFVLASSRGG